MASMAPPTRCPRCAADVPRGDADGGVSRYRCASCGHEFEVRSLVEGAPPPAAPPIHVGPVAGSEPAGQRVCQHCGHANAPHYRFCLGCGGDLAAGPQGPPAKRVTPLPKPLTAADGAAFTTRLRAMRLRVGALIGASSVFWLAFFVMFVSPRMCTAFGGSTADDPALSLLGRCARAQQLLGRGVEPAWVGCVEGATATTGSGGDARWHMTVEGSKGRGDLDWSARKKGGKWVIVGASLRVGEETVDVIACTSGGKQKSEEVTVED